MELHHKVALITGSAKRIGQTLALALAGEQCHVIVHYGRSAAEADETVRQLKELGVNAWSVAANLTNEAEVHTLVPFALEQAGRLDILINNAAIFPPEKFLETTSASWDDNMLINLKAPFLLSQDFARALPPDRPGKIINLLDTNASRPKNHHFAYTISKYALEGLTQATAVALGPRNIQVNGLALGAILPNTTDDPHIFARIAQKNNVPHRTGTPQDVAQAMLYLLKAADFVTGQVIRVDGGKFLI